MTALRVGLRSARLCQFAAALLAATACTSATPVAVVTPSPSPLPSPAATPNQSPTPPATHSPETTPARTPVPTLACRSRALGANTVLLGSGGEFGQTAIYDVTDPVHPQMLCRILRTSANLSNSSNFEYLDPRSATETDIVIKWFANGTETPGGKLPGWITDAAWTPSGTVGAFTVRLDSSGTCPAGAVQVWTYNQGTSELLTTYCIGIGDCICRFGLPGPVLAISPDGQYLVEGRLSGKGSEPMGVWRLADRILVATLPPDTDTAFWDRNSPILYVVRSASVQVWSPGYSLLDEPSAAGWSFYPNISPNGDYVAYTAYSDQVQGTQPRVYLYGTRTSSTKMLVEQPRSQVAFVKDGWVWYLEERPCDNCPNNTQPTGKVFAMDITTGVEQQVVFASGDAMTYPTDLLPGEFWPNF
jgi:hypothetical protein